MLKPHHPHLNSMPASVWRWAALGGTMGLLLALLLGAPARWLAQALVLVSEGRVRLQMAQGTVWQGDASLSLAADAGGLDARRLPGRLHWRLGWNQGGPSLQLLHDCCTPTPLTWQLHWQASGVRLVLDDQASPSQWPMGLLAGLGAPWNTLQAEGQMELQTHGLSLHWAAGRLIWHGRAQLQLHQLASRLSTLRPMGSYRLRLEGPDSGTPTPTLTLDTLTGPLRLEGSGQWVGHRLRFTGQAQAEPGAEAALDNLLNIIGRRDGARSLLSVG